MERLKFKTRFETHPPRTYAFQTTGESLTRNSFSKTPRQLWRLLECGRLPNFTRKINEAAGGSLETLNSAKDLLNPFKLLPRKYQGPVREKLNQKTGEIEKWLP